MRKVGHFIDYIGYARGGAETNVEGLCRHNDATTYEFEIITSVTPFQRPIFPSMGTRVRTAVGFHQMREAAFLFKGRLADVLYRFPATIYKFTVRQYLHDYDIIHCHGLDVLEAVLRVGKIAPVVLTIYNPLPERHLEMAAFADRIIVRSTELLSETRKHFENEKLVYIPPGCEFDYYRPPGEDCTRSETGQVKLLVVARLRPFKNIEGILRAIQILNSGPAANSYSVTIVGDGPLRGRLATVARNLGINDKVRFVGAVSSTRIGRFYHEADLIVVPSFYESFSQVSLESLVAQKRLLISSGMREFRSLFPQVPVCDPDSPEDIAARIVETLRKPPIVLSLDQLEAYSWPKVVRRHYEVYQSVLQTAPASRAMKF